MTNPKIQRYSRHGLWSLFLMCAFPIHFWTLLLAFRDFSWVAERTNVWDALGVVAYGMLFAFMESLIVFLIVVLLGFLASTKWDEPHRIALLSILVLIASFWSMYGQAHFVWGISPPERILKFIVQSGHPYRYLFGAALIEVVLTIAFPAFLVLSWNRFFHFMQEAIDRLSLLTSLYLVLDLFGLVIVVIRNI
jgi:hypothetical protein